jgi:multiple sugar transport system substrate-binding protein
MQANTYQLTSGGELMKHNFRRLLMVVLIAALAVLMTACLPGAGSDDTDGDDGAADEADAGADEGGEETAAGELPESCGTVDLQYWNPFTGPDGPFMGEMVDAFNSEHDNIAVTMTTQGDYYTQLSTAAASNTLPDVAIVHADQLATQAYRGVIRPMDDVAAAVGVTADDFPAGVWAAGEINGSRYSIPLDVHPMTMFVNMDLLEGAGIDAAPTTREEFEAAAEAMTEGDNHGFFITSGFPVRQIFEMLLYQFGGESFAADGSEATWNSEAGVEALEWMQQAQANYSEPNLEVDAELNAFKGGTVGIVWNGIWQTTNVTGEGVEFNGQATGVPQIGPNAATWGGSHQFTLPKHEEEDDCKDTAAAIFIKYMLDNSITWAKAGQIPASNSVRASAEFADVQPQASIAPSIEGVFFPPSVPGITDAYAPLDEAVSAIMAGTETDIQAALDNAKERADQILADNRETYGDAPPED